MLATRIGEPLKTAWRRCVLDAGWRSVSHLSAALVVSVAEYLKEKGHGTSVWSTLEAISRATSSKPRRSEKMRILPIGPLNKASSRTVAMAVMFSSTSHPLPEIVLTLHEIETLT
jgi:hypothetical protein